MYLPSPKVKIPKMLPTTDRSRICVFYATELVRVHKRYHSRPPNLAGMSKQEITQISLPRTERPPTLSFMPDRAQGINTTQE